MTTCLTLNTKQRVRGYVIRSHVTKQERSHQRYELEIIPEDPYLFEELAMLYEVEGPEIADVASNLRKRKSLILSSLTKPTADGLDGLGDEYRDFQPVEVACYFRTWNSPDGEHTVDTTALIGVSPLDEHWDRPEEPVSTAAGADDDYYSF